MTGEKTGRFSAKLGKRGGPEFSPIFFLCTPVFIPPFSLCTTPMLVEVFLLRLFVTLSPFLNHTPGVLAMDTVGVWVGLGWVSVGGLV